MKLVSLAFVLTAIIALLVSHQLAANNYPEDAKSLYELAATFDDDGSAKLDYQKALELYELSADQGYADAQNALGLMYYYGSGVEEDTVKAAMLYQKAVDQGNKYAQCNLAELYAAGDGVEKDIQKAIQLYESSIDQGYAPAAYELGFIYELGLGVKKDEQKAIELYKKSASQNNDGAIYRLARAYEKGEIIEQSYQKALELYKKISTPSDYDLLETMAQFYDEGKGVAKDHDAADELYKKADKQRYDTAREYSDIINKDILKLTKPSFKLNVTAREKSTFFGGKPMVLSDFQWPQRNGRSLPFIGQIDLSEISKENISWLPQTGRLLFFYDISEQPWGIYPKDQKSSVVLFDQGVGDLSVREYPADLKKDAVISAIKYLRADEVISYPTLSSVNFTSDDDYESYYTFLDEYYSGPIHKIGGHPSVVQNDVMESGCQGFDLLNATRKGKQDDWKLLLQFDTDDDIDVMWGDVGRLYFWVRESDAKKGVFSRTCAILQSH